ncbi:EAL domain-containing protein [Marinobacter sp.]|uniref:EAL domain-containing protein n=1 Tax=Marinobacter sp. TaxID=50741 RepID=UPI0035C7850C
MQSDLLLRPFVSVAGIAPPHFEVLSVSTRSALGRVVEVLGFFDEHLPGPFKGITGVTLGLAHKTSYDESLPWDLLCALRSRDIAPARVGLEVSESVVRNDTVWQSVVPGLADHGFRVGVKYYFADSAGFDVLASPYISSIKTDPRVIKGLARSKPARQYLRGLKTLAHALDKSLIVEGVDTIGQALWLEAMGCHTFQGDVYGPAMAPREALRFVLEGRQRVAPTIIRPAVA